MGRDPKTGRGLNAVRQALTEFGGVSWRKDMSGFFPDPKGMISKALVVDVITDISLYAEELVGDGGDTGTGFQTLFEDVEYPYDNETLFSIAPPNTIITMDSTGTKRLVFPFFSSHLCMPVKVGETVWIFDIAPGKKTDIPYWFCRVPGTRQTEDANWTCHDRIYEPIDQENADLYKAGTEETEVPYDPAVPGAPIGITSKTAALPGALSLEDVVLDGTVKIGSHNKDHTLEPVPRYIKRSGDLLLQGSNNTAILLGTDMPNDQDDIDSSRPSDAEILRTGHGSIDIVCGRGVDRPEVPGFGIAESADGDPETGAPIESNAAGTNISEATVPKGTFRNIHNSFSAGHARAEGPHPSATKNILEYDKNPAVRGEDPIVIEGDNDFMNDLSRIYLSMHTDVDANFGIIGAGDATDDAPGATPFAPTEGKAPAIAIVTDRLRLIAREDFKLVVSPNGNEADGAGIAITADGNIILSPGPNGVIKLGGEDCDKALICNTSPDAATAGDGASATTVTGATIINTMGGSQGLGDPTTGFYATKVLIK